MSETIAWLLEVEGYKGVLIDNYQRALSEQEHFHGRGRSAVIKDLVLRQLDLHPLQQCLRDNGDLIAAQATIAQQAQMIERLRGGIGNEPQLVSYAEDMSTCTLTTGDGTGYFYDRVDADQPALYTAVDMANAAADGFRDGAASRETEIEDLRKIATELRRWASCEHVHHDKRDQHEYDEPCKVLARIDKVLSKED